MELNDLDYSLMVKNYDKIYNKFYDFVGTEEYSQDIHYILVRLSIEKGIPRESYKWLLNTDYLSREKKLDLLIRALPEEEFENLPEYFFHIPIGKIINILKLLIEKNYKLPKQFFSYLEKVEKNYPEQGTFYRISEILSVEHKIPLYKIPKEILNKLPDNSLINLLSTLIIENRSEEIPHSLWEFLNDKKLIYKAIRLNYIEKKDVPSDIQINQESFKNYFNRLGY